MNFLKNSLLFTMLLCASQLFAQAPEGINYQAVIRNGGGTLITSTTVAIQVKIRQGGPAGTVVYQERHSVMTSAYGVVNLVIGGGTVQVGTFPSINWSSGTYYVNLGVDFNNGTTYQDFGSQQLISVPYALYAKSAGTVAGGGTGGGFTHYIGEEFGGGVVFHLWKDAQGVEHGLIVDKTDLSTSQFWSNINATSIGASAQSSWDGLSNSNAIVGQAGHTSSASALCLNSTNGGQSDWYLPSIQELNMLWNNYYTVARSLTQISGATQLQPAEYWSSSELDNANAWSFVFSIGYASGYFKYYPYYVRAVRAF